MDINLSELEDIQAIRGGRKKPVFLLSRGGYFNMNLAFKKLNELGNPKSVSLKASKKGDKLIVAFTFSEGDDKDFKVTPTSRESSWFSGRSLFSKFGIEYQSLVPKRKSLRLKTSVQVHNYSKYLITEIPIN